MRRSLRPHRDSPSSAATHIEVDVARSHAGSLALRYVVTGKIGDLRLRAATAATRADELWRHTCFEAFVGASAGGPYYEFNFAPSAQWAAYRFDGYRRGMRVATEIGAPRIEMQSSADRCTLQALLDLDRSVGLSRDAAWHLGLSAVIEDVGGRISYWALAHPPGKADFHHSDCFTCELEAEGL